MVRSKIGSWDFTVNDGFVTRWKMLDAYFGTRCQCTVFRNSEKGSPVTPRLDRDFLTCCGAIINNNPEKIDKWLDNDSHFGYSETVNR